jgi:hypothetical protein
VCVCVCVCVIFFSVQPDGSNRSVGICGCAELFTDIAGEFEDLVCSSCV